MGGGPLMDLRELYVIDECFKYARKLGISTYIMGCGIGPLKKKEYIDIVKNIISNSSKIALRDEISVNNAKEIVGDRSFLCLGDPAVISVERFLEDRTDCVAENIVSVCLREYPNIDYGKCDYFDFEMICRLINALSYQFERVILLPMHTFFVGGDDRYFLTKIAQEIDNKKVEVVHLPLNLSEVYNQFSMSKACIGMRYHSVVMQTILNGNNYILDYTDPENGKISGFINSLPSNGLLRRRVLFMQKEQKQGCIEQICKSLASGEVYNYKRSDVLDKYLEFIT